jgi:hypothetical protein
MATTRTPGITVLADGRRFIDKRYLGVRIGLRVGTVTQELLHECPQCGAITTHLLELAWRARTVKCSECELALPIGADTLRQLQEQAREADMRIARLLG